MNSSNKLFSLGSMANPSSLAELGIAIETETKRKKELAEKVMRAKGLTKEEKQEIYLTLTNVEPPITKKGAPLKRKRDKQLAMDYLEKKYFEKFIGINGIAKKHGFDNQDHTTIYKSLNKGLIALEADLKIRAQKINKMLSDYNKEMFPNSVQDYTELKYLESFTKEKLLSIELHKLRKKEKKETTRMGNKAVPINSLE